MKHPVLLVVAVAVVLALGVWAGWAAFLAREAPAPEVPGESGPIAAFQRDTPRLEPTGPATELERTIAPSDPPARPAQTAGSDPRVASGDEVDQWTRQFGAQSRSELRAALERVSQAADKERERIWSHPDLARDPIEVQVEPDASIFDVERSHPGPRAVTVARLLAGQKGRFELLLVPPERATELAALQREAAWLEARMATLPE